jgi:catechol 2,3-dioxygenase-like lactoylglutathione lyase family enzyme
MTVELALIVLRVTDLGHARAFYEALGLTFVREQHGRGPAHHAAQVGATVIELYPAGDAAPSGPGRLGFRVASIDDALRQMALLGAAVRSRQPGAAVVLDPDGRAVELSADPSTPA